MENESSGLVDMWKEGTGRQKIQSCRHSCNDFPVFSTATWTTPAKKENGEEQEEGQESEDNTGEKILNTSFKAKEFLT